MRRCQIYIPYQSQMLTVEELGGINEEFICFNPDRSRGFDDYKIQLTEKILLKFEDEVSLISILDFPQDEHFVIVDSEGKTLTDSMNTNPDFVTDLMNRVLEGNPVQFPRKDMN